MFAFPSKPPKKYIECGGPGPHATKKGSRWLVDGYHWYIQIEDGTYRCAKCYQPTIPKAKDYDKPIGIFLLTDSERLQLRTSLDALRGTARKMEERTLALEKEQEEKRQIKKQQQQTGRRRR